MKIVRYIYGGKTEYGKLDGDKIFKIDGDIFSDFCVTEIERNLSDVEILTPVEPTKIVAVGLNYRDHAKEMNEELPSVPKLFLKPSTAAQSDGKEIVRPKGVKELSYEAELAIVIGKKAKDVSKEEALDFVLGYTCLNDVTVREYQRADGQWTRAKGHDTFAPFGPCIATDVNPDNLNIKLILNGKTRQNSNTSNFIFKTAELVSFISGIMTLLPGDIITTGTPSGIGLLSDGDEVVVEIENIGQLKNTVRG